MTFQCSHSVLFSLLEESKLSLSAVKIRLEELCRFSFFFLAFKGSVQQGFSHYNSSLSVLGLPQAFAAISGNLLRLWGGDLFRFNRWELGLVLNLLRSLQALQIISQGTTIALDVWWVWMCAFEWPSGWDHAGNMGIMMTREVLQQGQSLMSCFPQESVETTTELKT